MYKTELKDPNVDGKVLSLPGVRDRAYVQIGLRSVGVVYRNTKLSLTINLKNNTDTTLYIFVENMGRLNFGNNLHDSKVCLHNVKKFIKCIFKIVLKGLDFKRYIRR
jgi:beta-galactosidase